MNVADMTFDEEALVSVDVTDQKPWNFRRDTQPTTQSNLMAIVRPEDAVAVAQRFLVGLREEGWYVVAPDPSLESHHFEEWCYDLLGPFPTRLEALKHLPDVVRKYADSLREMADQFDGAADSLRDSEAQWLVTEDFGRKTPDLRVATRTGS